MIATNNTTAPRATTAKTKAKYGIFEYCHNPTTGYFEQEKNYSEQHSEQYAPTRARAREAMPHELRIDPVRDGAKYGAYGVACILTSRQHNYQKAFSTGLQPVASNGRWFSGDVLTAGGGKSLVAVCFDASKTRLTVFVFFGFFKQHTRPRLAFVRQFLTEQGVYD